MKYMKLCDKQKRVIIFVTLLIFGSIVVLLIIKINPPTIIQVIVGEIIMASFILFFNRLFIKEEARLETIKKIREDIENRFKTHCNQLVEEVYEKWFDKPTPSKDTEVRWSKSVITEYSISHAKIIYREDEKINIKELEEPLHQNKRIVEEAMEHLKFYPETWSLWSHAKEQVEQNLKDVEKLWLELIQSLTERLSTCPQLVEFHVRGAIPDEYYSLRRTFDWLWLCVQDNRFLNESIVTQHDDHFLVKDFAQSLNKPTMEAVTEAIKELATDSAVQRKMKIITSQKTKIEENIKTFQCSLERIVDDVKRRDKKLKGNCLTCKTWLDELAVLET